VVGDDLLVLQLSQVGRDLCVEGVELGGVGALPGAVRRRARRVDLDERVGDVGDHDLRVAGVEPDVGMAATGRVRARRRR
jgi:hypothetical protein